MKITHAEIRNFRALQHIKVPLHQFSVILGENDAGKTSLLYAIEKFFSHKKLDDAGDWHKKKTDDPVVITLSFDEIPDTPETEKFAQEGKANIQAEFKHDASPKYTAILQDGGQSPIPSAEIKKHFSPDHYAFVPVNRNIAEHFSTGKTALLGKVIRQKMNAALDENQDAAKKTDELREILRQSVNEPRVQIQEFLREQLKNDSIKLNFDELEIDPLAGVSLHAQLSDDKSRDIAIQNRGAGTQNNLIIALFRFVAESGMGGNFILGLEEPENSLHPKAQRQLFSTIQDISEKVQVLTTTHSPVFIDRGHYENNIMLSRGKSGSTVAKTFSKDSFPEVGEELGIRASDALLKGGGNCALLVEGDTEEEGFPVFMEMSGINDAELGISIIKMQGSSSKNARRIIELLGCYNIPCIVVLDGDAAETKRELEKMQGDHLFNLKKVFIHDGTMEDYYPPNIIAEVINSKMEVVPHVNEDEIRSSSVIGKSRMDHIKKVLYEHKGKTAISFLKVQLGGYGTKLMQKKGMPVPPRIKEILEAAKKIATGNE